MLTQKVGRFKEQLVSLESLVPADNFYRQLEAKLDLSFVYDLVRDCYSPAQGRPAIDPVVFFKLQLIMFFEGLRSERQLMESVGLNLAQRWYISYDLHEAVPDHSSLSKIRDRYGLDVFQRFFEQIVGLCQTAGLVWGRELYCDGTKIRANAAMSGLVPRWYWQAEQHLAELFEGQALGEAGAAQAPASVDAPPTTAQAPADPPAPAAAHSLSVGDLRLVDASATRRSHSEPGLPATDEEALAEDWLTKYDGTRISGRRQPSYQRVTDSRVSPTDPDASPMSRFTGDKAKLGYHTHYVVDGGKARIILAALVTPASIMDHTPMVDLARWVRFRWHLRPRIAVGDTRYGTLPNIVGLETDGIRAYLGLPLPIRRTGVYPAEAFQYDAKRDVYHCPRGEELSVYSLRESEQANVYRADAETCRACPLQPKRTDSQSGRHVFRSFHEAYLERVRAYQNTEAYHKATRKRQVWVEPLFGEGKQWHQMAQCRLRRLEKVNMEGLMRAAGQNIKRLLQPTRWHRPDGPAAGALRQHPCFAQILRTPFQATVPNP